MKSNGDEFFLQFTDGRVLLTSCTPCGSGEYVFPVYGQRKHSQIDQRLVQSRINVAVEITKKAQRIIHKAGLSTKHALSTLPPLSSTPIGEYTMATKKTTEEMKTQPRKSRASAKAEKSEKPVKAKAEQSVKAKAEKSVKVVKAKAASSDYPYNVANLVEDSGKTPLAVRQWLRNNLDKPAQGWKWANKSDYSAVLKQLTK